MNAADRSHKAERGSHDRGFFSQGTQRLEEAGAGYGKTVILSSFGQKSIQNVTIHTQMCINVYMACWSEPPVSVDAYISELSAFARPVVERLRQIIVSAAPDLDEAIRWNSPSYKGKLLVCGFSAFQKHVALTFWQGASLPDPKNLLQNGQGRTAMRTVKYTAMDQIDDSMVRNWVLTAAALDRGEPVPQPKAPRKVAPKVPDALAVALKRDAKAKAVFEKMSVSHRREYCEWIAEAKQETTVQRRVEKALEKISQGEGLNDKYRN